MATLTFVGIVVMQIFWINKNMEMRNDRVQSQKRQVKLQEDQVKIMDTQVEILNQQFKNKATISLTNVRDRILSLNKESGYYLDPVKQITSNYFVVSINDTIDRFILETYLVDEFKANNILEVFEYGVYDCFTDSIIYDKYVDLSEVKVPEESIDSTSAPQQKWDHDGHYFGVYFPNREKITLDKPKQLNSAKQEEESLSYSLTLSTIILLVVFVFLAFAISIILKQKRLSEVRTDFINNMTHELKTPISTISISSEVLLNKNIADDPERIQRYAKIIFDENQRLESQVERVLQLAKLEKGKVSLKKEAIDVHEIIQNSIEKMQLSVTNKEGEIIANLGANISELTADKVHVTNIIYNLLDNANKYTPETPKIEITTTNNNDGISISIKDNGVGLSKDAIKHIFDKFYRVPTGNVHNVKGFGLGLHYVKVMVTEHGGTINVDSTSGQGSKFTIWLPLK
jgi:two-component system phosphate regulon sensor histidine kinase PhoR